MPNPADLNSMTNIINVLIILSIASERLVEIIKGLCPWLNEENPNPRLEGYRRTALQVLAVLSGVLVAYCTQAVLPTAMKDITEKVSYPALGLLVSGGSGFWNSILTYVARVKDVRTLDAKVQQARLKQAEAGHLL